MTQVGIGLPRREDERFLRGAARYLDDLDFPGLTHLVLVRSPHAHARLGTITTEAARRAPGVRAVLTASDLCGRVRDPPRRSLPGATIEDVPHPVLAWERVRYVGEPVAAVVADSRVAAEDAAELVRVSYEPLAAVLDVRQAQRGAPRLHDRLADNVLMRVRLGGAGVTEAFRRAERTVVCSCHLPRVAAVPLEPRGAVARYEPEPDLLTVWCSAQDPHRPRAQLSAMLDRPEERIRLIVPDVGGAFGVKGVVPVEAVVAVIAAMDLGRPVKWAEDRRESFLSAYQGRGVDGDVELALAGDGRILAIRARILADLGAYLLPSSPLPGHTTATLLTGPYAIGAAEVDLVGLATTKAPVGPYRGAGRPEAAFLLERAVEEAAAELGMDPVELRRRNVLRADAFPHSTPLGLTYDSGDHPRLLERVVAKGEYQRWREEQARARADGRLLGIGLALYVERGGGGWESAAVAFEPDGRVLVRTGSSPHGQGHETTFAQIVADQLRVPVDDVTVRWGDSSVVPRGTGTFGSRSLTMGGSAVHHAAARMRDKALALAAHILDAPASALVWDAGGIHVDGDDGVVLTIADLAAAAHDPGRMPPGIEHGLDTLERFESDFVFAAGAHLAVVEVERSTGTLRLHRITAVDDIGRVVNPLLAEGQVVGGTVQGLGQALTEEVIHDERGRPVTASFVDYPLLTAADLPPIAAEFVETASPLNPLGAKGVGEGGAIGAPAAVANAVADALGPLGVRHVDPPFTAEKLWRLVRSGRSRPQ